MAVKMKNKAVLTLLIFLSIVVSATCAMAGTETQLTQDERLTYRTAFDGKNVFWTEGTGNGVHAYDLATGNIINIHGYYSGSQINSYGSQGCMDRG